MSASRPLFGASQREDGGHWLSVSDLMAGLMMIFLFIAIIYMRQVTQYIEVAENTQNRIYEALFEEFKDDLSTWHAEIDPETMTLRFNEPDILFDQNSANLKPDFKDILADFFPRYVSTLDEFRGDIEEIRVEGHTSSEWRIDTETEDAYFMNMALSQDRTRNVLEYCLRMTHVGSGLGWLKEKIAAVGLSSARLITGQDGIEDPARSRRVEFTVKTNFERQIIDKTLSKQPAESSRVAR